MRYDHGLGARPLRGREMRFAGLGRSDGGRSVADEPPPTENAGASRPRRSPAKAAHRSLRRQFADSVPACSIAAPPRSRRPSARLSPDARPRARGCDRPGCGRCGCDRSCPRIRR
ncbi:hypothetical protein [Lysobacter gummosus]|uniref:hypothetical protein n=1 Tax=Lysobacter gummosus TaxID=262324 RepID=UPI0036327A2A